MSKGSKRNKLEIRTHALPDGQRCEIRANSDGSRTISGYAATFNTLSKPMGGFREKIDSAAFDDTLKDGTRKFLLYSHDWSKPLANTAAGTLKLSTDDVGLRFVASLNNTTLGKDVVKDIEARNLTDMSFGFTTRDDDWQQKDGGIVRTLKDIDLKEISLVADGAYSQPFVSLRSCPAEIRSFFDDVDNIDFDSSDDEADDEGYDTEDDDVDPVTGKKKKVSAEDEEDEGFDTGNGVDLAFDPGLDIDNDAFDSLRHAQVAEGLRRAVCGF